MYTDWNNPSLVNKEETKKRGHSSLEDGDTSSVQARQETQDQKISLTQIYTSPLSNMEVDTEAQKNSTEKLPNILTAMTQHDSRNVHHTAFVCQ